MIACTRCDGHGSTCTVTPCYRHACSRCHGQKHERCDCGEAAVRTSAGDRSVFLCAECGVKDDTATVTYYVSHGVSRDVATHWVEILKTVDDTESKRLLAATLRQELAEIEARCGRSAA